MWSNPFNRHRAVPVPALAERIRAQWAVFGWLDDGQWASLCELAARFLASKRVVGAADFEVDDEVRWTIALLGCLPAAKLGLAAYRDFVDIIVYPDRFIVDREHVDEAGVVHSGRETLSGEAMDLGPVVLAWPEILAARESPGYNVVIHEFVHKLDMADGEADGVPAGASRRVPGWSAIVDAAWHDFNARLARVERAIPRHLDPESDAADAWYASLPLDPYAATDRAEFFAVAGEAFFSAPERLQTSYPRLYRAMREYFGLDPLALPDS